MSQKLVIFDMDGVIFEGKNFWLDLHRIMGTEKQAWQLWNGLGKRDFQQLSNITAMKLWRNKSSDPFTHLILQRKLSAGVEAVFAYLHKSNIKSAIVSSGPYQLAERAGQLFGIDMIRANKLEIGEDGLFTGNVQVQVDENQKNQAALEVMKKLGAIADTSAMVGDSTSDIMIADVVSLAIAYNAKDADLLSTCKYSLKVGELSKVVDLLRREGF